MAEALTVVGESIASLALSLAAARHGRPVHLYIDPKRIGGSFAGLLCGERRFDLGCRLFELEYENVSARPLSTFDPLQDNHRPFIHEVAAFIRDILQEELQPAATPEMWIHGGKTRCPLMTVDLSEFPSALSATDRAVIEEQAHRILNTPSNLLRDTNAAPDATLCDASMAQHGARLHSLLIEAICVRQYVGWQQVLATERRKLWAALFHTRTVFEAFAGLPITFRPHRPFATTRQGTAHLFVRRLYQAVQACSRITVLPAGALKQFKLLPGNSLQLAFADGTSLQVPGDACAIGTPPEPLFTAAAIPYRPERLTASLLWVDVAERHVLSVPSSLMVCDTEPAVLRISNAGRTADQQGFAVEFGDAEPDFAIAVAALKQMKLVTGQAEVKLVHQVKAAAQVAPVAASRNAFETARRGLEHFSGVLLGGSRRFGFDSLNDQIADALFYGECLC